MATSLRNALKRFGDSSYSAECLSSRCTIAQFGSGRCSSLVAGGKGAVPIWRRRSHPGAAQPSTTRAVQAVVPTDPEQGLVDCGDMIWLKLSKIVAFQAVFLRAYATTSASSLSIEDLRASKPLVFLKVFVSMKSPLFTSTKMLSTSLEGPPCRATSSPP